MKIHPLVCSCSLAAALAVAAPVYAITCTINSTTNVVFGNYDVFDASHTDTTATISYQCDAVAMGETITIDIDKGNAPTFNPRTMEQTSYDLNYNLYTNAARTTIWGDGTSGTGHYGPLEPADGVETDVTVYARIPALQNARVGAFSDTVTVTVNF